MPNERSIGESHVFPARGDVNSQTARAFIGIRELLLRGAFARGERISELPMVARLGMSRTPIRLALERLAHIGLLDVGASGGFTVREFALGEVLDAIELRGVLEGTAARLAAERLIDESELEILRRHCDDMESLEGLTIHSFFGLVCMQPALENSIGRSPTGVKPCDQPTHDAPRTVTAIDGQRAPRAARPARRRAPGRDCRLDEPRCRRRGAAHP